MVTVIKMPWLNRFCGDFIEFHKIDPRPKSGDGEFLFVYRKKWERKITVLMWGLTEGGYETVIKTFKERKVDFTELLFSIDFHIKKSTPISILRQQGNFYTLN